MAPLYAFRSLLSLNHSNNSTVGRLSNKVTSIGRKTFARHCNTVQNKLVREPNDKSANLVGPTFSIMVFILTWVCVLSNKTCASNIQI